MSLHAQSTTYTAADGKLRVALSRQPYSPNGISRGPATMASGGIQDTLAKLGASVRVSEAALTTDELTEYGGWKKLGMTLGHFGDIVAQIGKLWLDAHPDFNTPETTRASRRSGTSTW